MAKRRIRNLRRSSNSTKQHRSCCQRKCVLITMAVITSIFAMLIYYVDNPTIAHRLREHVDRQYNYHMHGDMNYCDQPFHPKILTEALQKYLINQNDVLERITDEIENLENVTALALVGGSGVGKTLTCNILESNFQWPSNVFFFIWSAIDSPASQYYKIVNSVKMFSPKCGAYLVIIDNLGIKDVKTIEEMHLEIQQELMKSELTTLIVYVFNLSTYSDEDLRSLDDKRERLQNLHGITSINFRSFNRNDVEQCIELERQKLNMTLSNEEVEDLLQYIDWTRSGCKLVHSKIVMYA